MTPFQRRAIELRAVAKQLRRQGLAALAEDKERTAQRLEAADRAERRAA